jgi:hypothetical protein
MSMGNLIFAILGMSAVEVYWHWLANRRRRKA